MNDHRRGIGRPGQVPRHENGAGHVGMTWPAPERDDADYPAAAVRQPGL